MGLFVRTLKDYVDTGDTSGLARFLTNANVQVPGRNTPSAIN
jgi:hypothetical protein